MKIFLVRHGKTDANANKLFNGRNEKDLNDVGIQQAEELKERVKKTNWRNNIITSKKNCSYSKYIKYKKATNYFRW